MIGEIGFDTREKAYQTDRKQEPKDCVSDNVNSQQRPSQPFHAHEKGASRNNPGRHDDSEVAGKEVSGGPCKSIIPFFFSGQVLSPEKRLFSSV